MPGSNCMRPSAPAGLSAATSKLLSCRMSARVTAGSTPAAAGGSKGVGQPALTSMVPCTPASRAIPTAACGTWKPEASCAVIARSAGSGAFRCCETTSVKPVSIQPVWSCRLESTNGNRPDVPAKDRKGRWFVARIAHTAPRLRFVVSLPMIVLLRLLQAVRSLPAYKACNVLVRF